MMSMGTKSGVPRIDVSYLPPFVSIVEEICPNDGLIARLYPDGQLRSLGRYTSGRPVGWELRLERAPHGANTWGVVRREPGMGSTADWESYYADGTCERFDGWALDAEPYRMDWEEWVREWITRIAKP
jgi:hypothetical protein